MRRKFDDRKYDEDKTENTKRLRVRVVSSQF